MEITGLQGRGSDARRIGTCGDDHNAPSRITVMAKPLGKRVRNVREIERKIERLEAKKTHLIMEAKKLDDEVFRLNWKLGRFRSY